MAWKMTEKPQTVKITKTLGRQFAEMDAAPGDRPLSQRRLEIYKQIATAGGFRPVSWGKCYCVETDMTYRVNGKHTSTLAATWEGTLPELYAVIESYESETLEDVAKLYSTFDARTQTRTAMDIYHSFACTVPALAHMTGSALNAIVAGITYGEIQDSHPSSAQEKAERLLDNQEFAIWAYNILIAQNGRRVLRYLWRSPVVGAMLLTWRKNKRDADTFWTAVRNETGETPEAPDRRLAKWLTTNYTLGRSSVTGRNAPNREFLVRSLHAWNAWRRGQPTNLTYYSEADIPAVA